MPTRRIRARDLARHLREDLRRDTEVCRTAALELAAQGTALAVVRTGNMDLVDKGTYKRGWDFGPIPDGAEFGNTAPHASTLEKGRRPGRAGPPFEPIFEWVKRKFFDGYDPAEDEVEAERIAWAIRNALHYRGMKGRFVLRLTTDLIRAEVKPAMVRAIRARRGQ